MSKRPSLFRLFRPDAPASEAPRQEASTAWTFLTDAEQAARRLQRTFSGIEAVHAFHNELVSGDPAVHYLEHFRRRHLAEVPFPRVASLGAGEGHLERALLGMGWRFGSLVGLELNESLVKHAAARVAELPGSDNVSYRVADLNRLDLPPASLDLAIFFHSLHHVSAVETCLACVSRALRPGGRLLVADYFGGNRLQRPEATLERCDALLTLIPERLRVDLTRTTEDHVVVKERCRNLPVEQVIATDPSEAVRSEELTRLLAATPGLTVVEEQPLGGTVLDPLFQDIAGNFLPTDPVAVEAVRMAMAYEKLLLADGTLAPDYRYVVLERT